MQEAAEELKSFFGVTGSPISRKVPRSIIREKRWSRTSNGRKQSSSSRKVNSAMPILDCWHQTQHLVASRRGCQRFSSRTQLFKMTLCLHWQGAGLRNLGGPFQIPFFTSSKDLYTDFPLPNQRGSQSSLQPSLKSSKMIQQLHLETTLLGIERNETLKN